MKWSDRAIILSARRLGEHSAIIGLITPERGFYKGVDKGALRKTRRGIYQPGNIVSATWHARLPEHMGTLACELIEPVAAKILDSSRKLAVINSATILMEKILVERERQEIVFNHLETMLHSMCNDGDYLAEYVRLEFGLLACSGFGVDLERCAATGQTHDLAYVSPKSGRAVSTCAGRPYHGKLLILPDFLKDRSTKQEGNIAITEIMHGMRLCGHFIHERIFNLRNIPVPAERTRLMSILNRKSA